MQGSLSLKTAGKVKTSRKAKGKVLTLGSKRFTIPAKQTRNVTVKLSKKGMQAMKRNKKLKAVAMVAVTAGRPVNGSVLLRR